MTDQRYDHFPRYATILGACLLVAVAGCVTVTRPSPPSSATSRTSPAETPPHPAVTAYLSLWREVAIASHSSDWRSPALDDFATGAALATITEALKSDHERGVVAKGEPSHQAALSELHPDADPVSAVVVDCADDSEWLKYRVDNGQLVDDVSGGMRRITAEVTLSEPDTWKVSKFVVREVGSCP